MYVYLFIIVAEVESSRSHDDVPEVVMSKVHFPTDNINDKSSGDRGGQVYINLIFLVDFYEITCYSRL